MSDVLLILLTIFHMSDVLLILLSIRGSNDCGNVQ